jgi:hypothetical protein
VLVVLASGVPLDAGALPVAAGCCALISARTLRGSGK